MHRAQAFLLIALLAAGGCSAPQAPEPLVRPDPDWVKAEVLSAVEEEPGDTAAFVPSDVRVFVRLLQGAGIFDRGDDDPLAKNVWNAIQEALPDGFWTTAAERLEMTERELLQALFAVDLTLVEQEIHDVRKVVVLSRVRTDILERLPAAAGLTPYAPQPSIGPFRLFVGKSDNRDHLLALGKTLFAFSSINGADHLRRLLVSKAAGKQALADHDSYRDLLSRLPENRNGVIFTQSPDGSEAHALVVIRDGKRYEAHYTGSAPKVRDYIKTLETKRGVDFGPLPGDVVMAGSMNMLSDEVPAEGMLDLLLFPHSFRNRVLPLIEPTLLFFLGKVSRTRVEPDPGFDVPVFGLALRMKDPRVAADLDRICSGIHFLVSMSRLALVEGFFGITDVEKDGMKYHLADFGPILRATGKGSLLGRLASLPNAEALTRLAFGRVGSFYMICTQEMFFQQWHDAANGRTPRLDGADSFNAFEFQDHEGLILSVLTRGRELSDLLDETITFLDQAEGAGEDTKKPATAEREVAKPSRAREEAKRLRQPMRWLADGLERSRTFSMQLWHGDDGLLHGKLVVLR